MSWSQLIMPVSKVWLATDVGDLLVFLLNVKLNLKAKWGRIQTSQWQQKNLRKKLTPGTLCLLAETHNFELPICWEEHNRLTFDPEDWTQAETVNKMSPSFIYYLFHFSLIWWQWQFLVKEKIIFNKCQTVDKLCWQPSFANGFTNSLGKKVQKMKRYVVI